MYVTARTPTTQASLPASFHDRHITVTLPLHYRYITDHPGSHVELERVPPEQMPSAELAARRSRLVFIGRTAGLEATLRQGFEAM